VSGEHCRLTPEGKSILVEDTKSTNGTRINGVPIAGFIHADSDSILGVGRTELRLKLLLAGDK
jgi:pSer/pThr/pTyr-binding forkhead associated (FHA) protein